MKNIYDEVQSLDHNAYSHYHMSEELLMEHAALGIMSAIEKQFSKKSSVLIIAGSGHNGADGLALARLLSANYQVSLFLAKTPQSALAKKQLERLQSIEVPLVNKLHEADIMVDALFGSGLNRPLSETFRNIITEMNALSAYKIACDLPSGLMQDGTLDADTFKADLTVTMGGLKSALFSDQAKNVAGEIICVDLGIPADYYQTQASTYLLEATDMKLPHRKLSNSHKGSYGHANFIAGTMSGAALMSATAAYHFGAGLTTIISPQTLSLPMYLMQSTHISPNVTAIAVGMGLGSSSIDWKLLQEAPCPLIIDADLFYNKHIKSLLREETIITPHPKEFVSLLKLLNIADICVDTLQENRLYYAKLFCKNYPKVVLLLKGANVIIAYQNRTYINSFGTATLAKGGSGDILTGLITALRAQGYSALDAAISGSLAHTLSLTHIDKNSFAVSAEDIIHALGKL